MRLELVNKPKQQEVLDEFILEFQDLVTGTEWRLKDFGIAYLLPYDATSFLDQGVPRPFMGVSFLDFMAVNCSPFEIRKPVLRINSEENRAIAAFYNELLSRHSDLSKEYSNHCLGSEPWLDFEFFINRVSALILNKLEWSFESVVIRSVYRSLFLNFLGYLPLEFMESLDFDKQKILRDCEKEHLKLMEGVEEYARKRASSEFHQEIIKNIELGIRRELEGADPVFINACVAREISKYPSFDGVSPESIVSMEAPNKDFVLRVLEKVSNDSKQFDALIRHFWEFDAVKKLSF